MSILGIISMIGLASSQESEYQSQKKRKEKSTGSMDRTRHLKEAIQPQLENEVSFYVPRSRSNPSVNRRENTDMRTNARLLYQKRYHSISGETKQLNVYIKTVLFAYIVVDYGINIECVKRQLGLSVVHLVLEVAHLV